MSLKSAVEQAIAEVRETFAGHTVDVTEDGQGGARVRVHDLHIGNQFRPSTSWVEFVITFQYPAADVYPHYIAAGLVRVDGAPLGEGFGVVVVPHLGQVTQLSRRSNQLNQTLDTAAMKLGKVLTWLRSR